MTAAALAALLLGCTNSGRPDGLPNTDAGVGATDAVPIRDIPENRLDVVPVDPCREGPCGPEELCGPSSSDGRRGSGNGVDDNCDGRVDEFCPCTPGEMRACFTGAPDRRGAGACRDGVARCTELGAWIGNECVGATAPSDEVCDGRDDDCNGSVDDGIEGCATTLRCPASVGVEPLTEYVLDGRTVDPSATGYQWSLECPAGLDPCPAITDSAASTLRVGFASAGLYRLTVRTTRADGSMNQCAFPVYVQGRGLRVELDWDRKGGIDSPGVDMDLHVAPIDRRRLTSFSWFTPNDCYFQTCKAPGGTVNWANGADDTRFAPTNGTALCEGFPPPFGEAWRASGRCWNPRLDVDNITCDPSVRDARDSRYCFPENVTVDAPPDDMTFRLMVNFYRDHGTCTDSDTANDVVHPLLRVNCGGIERAEVGGVEDGQVSLSCGDNPGIGSRNWSWIAADVRFVNNACGLRDCRVTPLRAVVGRFTPCAMVAATDDVCMDATGHVFVRNSGSRPIDVEFGESP